MADIYQDYMDSVHKAEELEELARRINEYTVDHSEDIMQAVNCCWQGDAGAEFMKKLSSIKERMEKDAADLKEQGAALRQDALNHYEAEKAAQELLAYQNKVKAVGEAAMEVIKSGGIK